MGEAPLKVPDEPLPAEALTPGTEAGATELRC